MDQYENIDMERIAELVKCIEETNTLNMKTIADSISMLSNAASLVEKTQIQTISHTIQIIADSFQVFDYSRIFNSLSDAIQKQLEQLQSSSLLLLQEAIARNNPNLNLTEIPIPDSFYEKTEPILDLLQEQDTDTVIAEISAEKPKFLTFDRVMSLIMLLLTLYSIVYAQISDLEQKASNENNAYSSVQTIENQEKIMELMEQSIEVSNETNELLRENNLILQNINDGIQCLIDLGDTSEQDAGPANEPTDQQILDDLDDKQCSD